MNYFLLNSRIKADSAFVRSLDYVIKQERYIEISEIEINMIPFDYKLNIVYEDDFVLVVDKDRNMIIHSDGNTYETLTNAVFAYLRKKGKVFCCYPIHRIDADATGIVIFAKNIISLCYLSKQIEQRTVYKEYECIVKGIIRNDKITINKPISKDRHSNKQIVSSKGKKSTSFVEVIEKFNSSTRVKVVIDSGRKHQIRVHMASIGHPIIGDKLYNIDETQDHLKLRCTRMIYIDPVLLKEKEVKTI